MKKTTMAIKARLICDTLALSHFDSEFMRRDLVEADPLTWLVEVDGVLVDNRYPSAQSRCGPVLARPEVRSSN